MPKSGKSHLEALIRERFDQVGDEYIGDWATMRDPRTSAMLSFFGDVGGKAILDVGCGKGKFAYLLAEHGAVSYGIDLSDHMIRQAKDTKPGLHLAQASATALPFPAEVFDGVICFDTLEHIPDTRQAIAEMTRVVRPSGKILIIDKNLLSVTGRFPMPTAVRKKLLELTNRWMYPRGFPFTEKYFVPKVIERILAQHCRSTRVQYLGEDQRPRWLFRRLPWLKRLVAWQGVK